MRTTTSATGPSSHAYLSLNDPGLEQHFFLPHPLTLVIHASGVSDASFLSVSAESHANAQVSF